MLPVLGFSEIKVLLLFGFVVYGGIAFYRRIRIGPAEFAASGLAKHQYRHQWNLSRAAFRGDWLFGLFLLSLPVINPWYVPWMLPFATLFPGWWCWTASYFILLSYWYGSNVGAIGADSLQLPISVLVVEYGLIVLIPTTVWLLWWLKSRHSKPTTPQG